MVRSAAALVCLALAGPVANAAARGDAARLQLDVAMPGHAVDGDDAYLCTAVALPQDARSVVRITPNADQEVVHHMLLFGCTEAMAEPGTAYPCKSHAGCNGGEHVFYGWGRNAPKMEFPDGVGVAVGQGTELTVLVLQVHYLNGRPAADRSGLALHLAPSRPERTVSVLFFAPWFSIPPGRKAHNVSDSCCYDGFEPLVPLAARVHAHALGQDIALERSADPLDAGPAWASAAATVVSRSPQLPQGFVPVADAAPIVPGDFLQATCTFDSSDRDTVTRAGADSGDEMCNLYLMVHSRQPHFQMCSAESQGDGGLGLRSAVTALPLPAATDAGGAEVALGPMSAVSVDPSDGTIWVFARRDTFWDAATFAAGNKMAQQRLVANDTVFQLHPETGRVLSSWGAMAFAMPHGLTVDWHGNLWLTDAGMHQVFKTTKDGKVLLELGADWRPGSGLGSFCKPTDVAILADGAAFISDGYCNARVVYVPPGATTAAPGALQEAPLSAAAPVVHSVAANNCRRQVEVVDREAGGVHRLQLGPRGGDASGDGILRREFADVLPSHHKRFGQFKIWAIRTGPAGRSYMLIQTGEWQDGVVRLVATDPRSSFAVELPGVNWPHDFAFGTLPAKYVTGTAPTIVYVTETPPKDARPAKLHRFVLADDGDGWHSGAGAASQPEAVGSARRGEHASEASPKSGAGARPPPGVEAPADPAQAGKTPATVADRRPPGPGTAASHSVPLSPTEAADADPTGALDSEGHLLERPRAQRQSRTPRSGRPPPSPAPGDAQSDTEALSSDGKPLRPRPAPETPGPGPPRPSHEGKGGASRPGRNEARGPKGGGKRDERRRRQPRASPPREGVALNAEGAPLGTHGAKTAPKPPSGRKGSPGAPLDATKPPAPSEPAASAGAAEAESDAAPGDDMANPDQDDDVDYLEGETDAPEANPTGGAAPALRRGRPRRGAVPRATRPPAKRASDASSGASAPARDAAVYKQESASRRAGGGGGMPRGGVVGMGWATEALLLTAVFVVAGLVVYSRSRARQGGGAPYERITLTSQRPPAR